MIQVEMNKDIQDFSPKVISIFDKRQLVCLGISASYGLPLMLYADGIDFYTRVTAAVILMAPVIACGWVKMYGLPLERFLLHIIKNCWLTPSRRRYRTENTLSCLCPEDRAVIYKEAGRVKRSRGEKKKYAADMATFGAVR